MLSNIAQLKVKSKAHPQNHSSGINMRQTHSITWKQQGYVGNYYLAKQLNSCCCFFCISTKFLFLSLQTQQSFNHVIRVVTPYLHKFFKGEREYICFKNVSDYEVKQNLTWRELFAIQFALQFFAPKTSNKSVCWETENSAASLTVTSESNNTGSPDLLDTQSYKTFKNT